MKFVKAGAVTLGCLLPLTTMIAPASAEVFDWTLFGPAPDLGGVVYPGSGTLTATETSTPGEWDVTAITGTVNGSAINGLSSFFGANNVVFTNGFAFLSTSGLGFTTEAGQSINIFSFTGQETPPSGNNYGEFAASPGGFGVGTFTLSAAAAPEPATWAMLLIGFAGLGYAGYRTSAKRAAALA